MSRTGIIAHKLGMSSLFNDQGQLLPVTLLKVDACQVVAHKTTEKDGYSALVVGAKNAKPNRVSKPMRTVFANSKVEPKSYLREFRIDSDKYLDIGTELKVDHFARGQIIDICGTSIGKGFAEIGRAHV